MLILSRRVGQKIIVDNKVSIEIKDIKGQCVKLSIDGPRDITINREEVQEMINKDRKNG